LIAPAPQHLSFNLKSFGRARVGGNRFVDELVSLLGSGSRQQTCELYFWSYGAGIQLDRLTQQRFRLVPIAHTRSGGAKGSPDLAFEDRVPIPRLDQIQEVREFVLTQQGICQHRYVVFLIAIAIAGRACLALRRCDIAELEVYLREPRVKDRVLRRLSDGVAQLDFGGLEVSLCDILLGLFDRGRSLLGV
jgi:hypothetical protein